ISSSGEVDLQEGDFLSIVQDPEVWKLSYKGLDLTSEDRKNLKFEIKTSNKDISASKGPYTSCDVDPGIGDVDSTIPTICDTGTPVQAACTIYAPYIQVTSGDTGSVFETARSDAGGDLSDDEFFVTLCDASSNDCNPDIALGPFESAVCDGNNDGLLDGAGVGAAVPYFAWNTGGFAGTEVDFGLPPGTVFMKTSPSSDDYGFLDYFDTTFFGVAANNKGSSSPGTEPGTVVKYSEIGDGDEGFPPPKGGAILIQTVSPFSTVNPGDSQLGNMMVTAGWSGGFAGPAVPDVLFGIAEKAGTGSSNDFVDYFVFGVDDTGTGSAGDATFDFDSDDGAGFTVTSDNEEVLYGHATSNAPNFPLLFFDEYYCTTATCAFDGKATGPVTDGMEVVEEQYVSERGSVFKTIDDNTVEFDMAHKLARAQWFLAPSSTSEGDATKTIVTLGEGESTTVSGVTVKVLEITESVGACSASGGSVSCTADMSGVSAVIMPNNAPSVTVAMPSQYAGNLIVYDSDASGVATMISVGGDKVNTVSADWLSSAPVDWTAEKKVVREMAAGKILVAGAEKEDTLAAAQDFLAQVKKV
ncbi:MAG TPA: hypothetical protein VLD37_02140, partial [Candidatus Bilamarchaeum sp.]|nr:hypothetical protein [Candidatus Bilamarchaeum sp.]